MPLHASLQTARVGHGCHLGPFANHISTMQVAVDYLSAIRSAASLSRNTSSQQLNTDVSQQKFGNTKGVSKSDWEKVFQRGLELAAGPPTDHFLQVNELSNPSWNATSPQVSTCIHHAVDNFRVSDLAVSYAANSKQRQFIIHVLRMSLCCSVATSDCDLIA